MTTPNEPEGFDMLMLGGSGKDLFQHPLRTDGGVRMGILTANVGLDDGDEQPRWLHAKIHRPLDVSVNSTCWILTGWEGVGVTQIRGLIDGLDSEAVILDKGYNAERLKQFCRTATQYDAPAGNSVPRLTLV